MRAIKIEEPGHARLVEVPVPSPARDELLIKVMASGICGTDIHILRGEYLGAYPVIPGHEFSGIVEKTGDGVNRLKAGDRVAVEPNLACDNCQHCLSNRQNFCSNWQAIGVTRPGGMGQYVVAPEKAAFSIGNLPFEHGALVEPLSCVLHGIERSNIRMGDRVVLLGAGPIGILLLQVLRLRGATEITVVERDPSRAEYAQSCGAQRCSPDLDALKKDSYDVVVDATGDVRLMALTVDFVRHGGTVLLFGVPPAGQRIELEAFTIFRKGLNILSSFTSVRNSYQAVALIQSGCLDLASLISHRLRLNEFERGVELIERKLEGVRKVVVFPQT